MGRSSILLRMELLTSPFPVKDFSSGARLRGVQPSLCYVANFGWTWNSFRQGFHTPPRCVTLFNPDRIATLDYAAPHYSSIHTDPVQWLS